MNNFIEKNRNINRGFRKLQIWQLAVDLYKLVSTIITEFDKIPYKVQAQIKDAALSVSSNIAEGYSRRSLKENLRFNEISLSSLAENYSQLFTLLNANEISEEAFNKFDIKAYELENKLISMNKKLITKLNNKAEWKSEYI
ncbi:MAG: four helix bundle protein [Ignavibacteriae bacterium]|nr:four helix bundle protein [Ignavibacteriota bacterium]